MKLTKRFTILILSIFFAIGLVFSFVPKIAKADTTDIEYRFTGSNIFLPFVGSDDRNGYKKGFYLLTFEFAPILNQSSFDNKYQVVLRGTAFYVTNIASDTFFNISVSYADNYNSLSKATHTLETLSGVSVNYPLSGLNGYLLPDNVRPNNYDFNFGGYAEMSISSLAFVPNIAKIEIGSNTTSNSEFPQTYIPIFSFLPTPSYSCFQQIIPRGFSNLHQKNTMASYQSHRANLVRIKGLEPPRSRNRT